MKPEHISALVLAGDTKTDDLTRHCGVPTKALIAVAGEPMVQRVVRVLQQARPIDRVVVIGFDALRGVVGDSASLVAPGGSFSENIQRGWEALDKAERVLVTTCDVPLLTPEAVEHFVQESLHSRADLTYPIVSKSVCEARFPAGRRTYATLMDGTFTGGNMVVLSCRFLENSLSVAQTAFAGRKSPLKLARLLGVSFVLKFFLRRLTVADVQARVSHLLQCRATAIVSPYAEVAFDVDKVSDWEEVERHLTRSLSSGEEVAHAPGAHPDR